MKKNIINGELGGILEGKSHEEGGIPMRIKATNEMVEVQGNEAIINAESLAMKDKVVCEGTPIEVASAINSLNGNGVKFTDGGVCYLEDKNGLRNYNIQRP